MDIKLENEDIDFLIVKDECTVQEGSSCDAQDQAIQVEVSEDDKMKPCGTQTDTEFTLMYACPYCDRVFTAMFYYKKHIFIAHTDLNPFVCKLCHRSFKNETDRTNHVCYTSVESLQKEVQDLKDKIIQNETQNAVKLDRILEILSKGNSITVSSTSNTTLTVESMEGLPLTTETDLEEFESKLEDREFKMQFVRHMKHYAGATGKSEGEKVAFKIIDRVFTRDLLKRYTWTGVSKGTIPKKVFRVNNNIINAFFEVVNMADSQYTLSKNETFFKEKILRHSEARSKSNKK